MSVKNPTASMYLDEADQSFGAISKKLSIWFQCTVQVVKHLST